MKENILNQKGFSLLEILVAMALIAVVMAGLQFGGSKQRDILEETIENFDRAIRYSQNEAILLGKVTRIKIDFESAPVEYVIEQSSKSNLLLGQKVDLSKLSLREREEWEASNKKTNQQFSRSSEFADEAFKVEEPLTIVGMGHLSIEKVQDQGDQSIYFYPSGTREAAIIFFSSENEFAALEINAFSPKTRVLYHNYTEFET
ncbi:prepilin-type N-terminal cleavage/methylation domain-containing protein, partial [Bacteriovoracaceae bacterium]|nr:prepilin-type N-terminal cleavage/methylation domain-containing protein [Bacteriovoracaceae bacterium]